MFIGEIKKGHNLERCNGYFPGKYCGKPHIERTVQLKSWKQIPPKSHAYILLTAIRPRQSTCARFNPSSSKVVEAIYRDEPLPHDVGSLTPEQLEVICYEYLRNLKEKKKKLLDALLFPIGRTLPDVDICGIDKNRKKVFAQVTHNKDAGDINKKIKDLKKYGGRLFFFGPEEHLKKYKDNDKYKAIDFVSIETVFTKSKKSMIETMLPKQYLETKTYLKK